MYVCMYACEYIRLQFFVNVRYLPIRFVGYLPKGCIYAYPICICMYVCMYVCQTCMRALRLLHKNFGEEVETDYKLPKIVKVRLPSHIHTVHTYIHLYLQRYKGELAEFFLQPNIPAPEPAQSHGNTHTYIHTYIHAYIHTYIPVPYRTSTYSSIHTYIHNKHICTYVHTYTHTYIQ